MDSQNEHVEAEILDAVEKEREACASMVEDLADECGCQSAKSSFCECFGYSSLNRLADEIRKRCQP